MMKRTSTIIFSLKRFLRYFLTGLLSSLAPFFPFSTFFGLPSILIASIGLASVDVISTKKEQAFPKTFTRAYWMMLFILLLVELIIYIIFMFAFSSPPLKKRVDTSPAETL